jgi:DNA-binding transcriptional LysR family regulator
MLSMELRHLRYFVAVAEELNFRRASERLHVAQPALSRQIKDLEFELEVRLFDRDTGGVRLTDAGAAFLVESRLTLAQSQQAILVAREAAKGRRGRLSIGYLAPLLMGFMPAGVKRFEREFPDVEVVLNEMPMIDQIAALESGEIHLGFVIGHYVMLPANLQHKEIARAASGAIVGRQHRFAKLSRVGLEQVARERLVCLANKKGSIFHGDIMRRIFANRGISHGPIKAIEGTETFRAALESGAGISVISELGSLSHSRDLVFKRLKETGDDLIMDLHAIWRAGDSSSIVQNFIDILVKVNAPGKIKTRGAPATP